MYLNTFVNTFVNTFLYYFQNIVLIYLFHYKFETERNIRHKISSTIQYVNNITDMHVIYYITNCSRYPVAQIGEWIATSQLLNSRRYERLQSPVWVDPNCMICILYYIYASRILCGTVPLVAACTVRYVLRSYTRFEQVLYAIPTNHSRYFWH